MRVNINLLAFLMSALTLLSQCTGTQKQEQAAEEPESAAMPQEEWVYLFNGENLDNWELLGGDADFSVEDGMIVGTTEEDLPNCFLTTRDNYSDFVLEVDFKIDPNINSGVQIISTTWEKDTTTSYVNGSLEEGTRDWEAGRVVGYQIEIDPSDRAWTGGFYEEGGRGWLQPLTENDSAQQAFKPGEWNQMRIRAEGNHFESWINGVKAVDATDDTWNSGFIGLQLHGAWRENQIGQKVYFKDIRLRKL